MSCRQPTTTRCRRSRLRIGLREAVAQLRAGALWIVDRFVFSGHEDLEELAVVRPADDRVADAGWLDPARPGDQPLRSDALEVCLEPALQAVDQLKLHIVVMSQAEFGAERRDHAD